MNTAKACDILSKVTRATSALTDNSHLPDALHLQFETGLPQ